MENPNKEQDIKQPTNGVEAVKNKEPEKVEETEKPEEPKKEEKKVEKAEAPESKVNVEKLEKELAEAKEEASKVLELNATVETLKKDVEAKDSVIKTYEDLVSNLVNTKLEQVPEEYKELIPDNLDLIQKLSWLEKAESKGLFNKEDKKKPNVEIGKPMNVESPQVDTTKLTGSQLLRMAYQTIK